MASQLDLRYNGKIPSRYVKLWDQIAYEIHKPFTDFIDSLSKQHAKSIGWWVSSPASRNTFASPLFHYCCCIALLQDLIQKNEPFSEIIVDSRVFKKIIEDYLAKQGVNARVTLSRLPVKQRLKEFVRPIYAILAPPLRYFLLFFAARQTRSLRRHLPSEPLTLIDTFVVQGYIEKDRYYPGMLNALSEKEKQGIWFVPYLYGFRPWQYLSVVKIRAVKVNGAKISVDTPEDLEEVRQLMGKK